MAMKYKYELYKAPGAWIVLEAYDRENAVGLIQALFGDDALERGYLSPVLN